MSATKVSYKDLFQQQNVLRIANRRLLEQICPKNIHDNLSALLSNNEKNINVISPKGNVSFSDTKKMDENVRNEEEEDDGYKSGQHDISEDISVEKQTKNELLHSQTDLSTSKTSANIKPLVKRGRPSSAPRVSNKPKSSSPFHQRCKPIEPNRHFVAIPFPSNLYQSDNLNIPSKLIT